MKLVDRYVSDDFSPGATGPEWLTGYAAAYLEAQEILAHRARLHVPAHCVS